MKTLLIFLTAVGSGAAWGWEPVCQFSFQKTYEGVRVGRISVHRDQKAPGQWRFAVAARGLAVEGNCPAGSKRVGYVNVRVASSEGGFLETGDLIVTGSDESEVWRLFDPLYLKDCNEGAVIQTRWACLEDLPLGSP